VRIATICGSLQASSSNDALLRAADFLAPDGMTLVAAPSIGDLPHYNPDLDTEPPLPAVAAFRAALAAADAVLIATPEYAHEMPGVLKNALDWVVGSPELVDKAVAIMSAGTGGGEYVLRVLRGTLEVMSARVVAELGVGGVRTKRDERGDITDVPTLEGITTLLARLGEAVEAQS
jgi:chromate reductase, NAD(P)H dehydrogenase (quinone)